MHFLAAILPVLVVVSAAHNPPHLRHRRLAHDIQQREDTSGAKIARSGAGHADAHQIIKRTVNKRGQTCRPRPKAQEPVAASSAASSAAAPSPTIENQNAVAHGTHSTASSSSAAAPAWTAPPPPPPAPSPPAPPLAPASPQQGGQSWGTLSVNDGKCGWCNADGDHPNGSQDWLNCGLNSGGWSPPHVNIDQLIVKDLNPNGVFAPCAQYFDLFRQYGGEFHGEFSCAFQIQYPLLTTSPSYHACLLCNAGVNLSGLDYRWRW